MVVQPAERLFPGPPERGEPPTTEGVPMSNEDGSNVIARGFGAIRNAFTGKTDTDDEQPQPDNAQRTPDDGESTVGAEEPTAAPQGTADEYVEVMEQCAAGDLTTRMEADGESEQRDRVAAAFNEMVAELEKATGHLKSYVDEVEAAGKGVKQSSDTVRDASEDVVDSMQNISRDVQGQREQLGAVAERLDDVAASLEQVATDHPDADVESQITHLEKQASELRDAASTSEVIQTEATITSAAVEEQAAELGDVSGRANDLQRYAKPLSAILDRFDTTSEDGSGISTRGATGGGQGGTGD